MPPSCDVEIALDRAVDFPADYNGKHRFLSSEARVIHVSFQGGRIYSTTVPRSVFNPYKGIAAHKLIELVLKDHVSVAGKRVADLGCGSGVIGLACVRKGAASVLFTDINPSIAPLRDHPMLRPVDRVTVQDLLTEEAASAFEVVVTSTPTNVVSADRPIDVNSVEGAIFRTDQFLSDLTSESARCLVAGGTLAMWVKISHHGLLPYHEFLMELNRSFDLGTMKILWHALESDVNVGTQEASAERSHLVFSIQKHALARERTER